MKKKYRILILLGILVLVLGGIVSERLFAVQIHRGNMISSTEELSLRITEELTQGNHTFSTYINGLSEDQLSRINHNLDGFFGHVSSYIILRKVNADVSLVRFELNPSNNYYVYQKVVNGTAIQDNSAAELLSIKVQQIMDQYEKDNDYETVVSYHDYIVSHVKYGFLDGEEEQLSYTAEGALLKGTAVCNGYAEAMELLLLCSGIDTRMAVGTASGVDHAWNIVDIQGQWYHVDTTWDDPVPDTGEDPMHVYLNIDDTVMEKTHTWNRNAYPACTSMDYNYYEQTGTAFDNFNDFKDYVLNEMKETDRIEVMVTDADKIQYDCAFVVKEGGADTVSWQSYEDGNYMVMIITTK